MNKGKKTKQSKRQTGLKKKEKKVNKKDVGSNDRFGLVASFMQLSNLLFGKGWNATNKKRK